MKLRWDYKRNRYVTGLTRDLPKSQPKICDYCGELCKMLDDKTALCFECDALLPSTTKSTTAT